MSPEDYEKYAADCLAMAEKLPPSLRPALVEVAAAWVNLAIQDKRHPRPMSAADLGRSLLN